MAVRGFACLLMVLATSACASITEGSSQDIAVDTGVKRGAACTLANEKGSWSVPSTPGLATVAKAYGALAVSCAHPDGEKGTATLTSTTAGAAFGNIIAGGLVGAAIDMGSGAAYKYPETVSVALAPPGRGVPALAPTPLVPAPYPPAPAASAPMAAAPGVPAASAAAPPTAVAVAPPPAVVPRLSQAEAMTKLRELTAAKEQRRISQAQYEAGIKDILTQM